MEGRVLHIARYCQDFVGALVVKQCLPVCLPASCVINITGPPCNAWRKKQRRSEKEHCRRVTVTSLEIEDEDEYLNRLHTYATVNSSSIRIRQQKLTSLTKLAFNDRRSL